MTARHCACPDPAATSRGARPIPCDEPPTAEDLLCEDCRENCSTERREATGRSGWLVPLDDAEAAAWKAVEPW